MNTPNKTDTDLRDIEIALAHLGDTRRVATCVAARDELRRLAAVDAENDRNKKLIQRFRELSACGLIAELDNKNLSEYVAELEARVPAPAADATAGCFIGAPPPDANLSAREVADLCVASDADAGYIQPFIEAFAARAEKAEADLAAMTKERDRLRDVKWSGIVALETNLTAQTALVEKLREALVAADCDCLDDYGRPKPKQCKRCEALALTANPNGGK